MGIEPRQCFDDVSFRILHVFAESFDDFGQPIVQRSQDVAGLGVMAGHELGGLRLVAAAAVLGRHDRGDRRAVVIERVDVAFTGQMAIDAADAFHGVRAPLPVIDDAGRRFLMALDALLRRGGDRNVVRGDPGFFAPAGDFHRLDENQRAEE